MRSRSILLRMRNFSDKTCRENQNTCFTFNIPPTPRKLCRLWDNMQKYGSWRGQRWKYNTAHALSMLDNQDCRHKLRICNTYWFSTTTTATRKRLSVTLYVNCLSFSIFKTCQASYMVPTCITWQCFHHNWSNFMKSDTRYKLNYTYH